MIRIVTDSTCEGTPALMANERVTVVPLTVVFGQQALRDGLEITRDEFWQRLPTADPLPKTSQGNPVDFIEPFRRFTDAGDEVVAVILSSKLSGTYDSAVQARESLPGRPIEVVDSHSVSVGLALMVRHAVEMAEAGMAREAIAAKMLEMREHVHIFFALDTLEYLQRGGRIGKAQALVGTLLKFKPLLAVREGEVHPVGRVRTRAKALESLVELLTHDVKERGPHVKLAVTQAAAMAEAQQVASTLCRELGTTDSFINTLGPVVGVHVGPGTVGAAAYVSGGN